MLHAVYWYYDLDGGKNSKIAESMQSVIDNARLSLESLIDKSTLHSIVTTSTTTTEATSQRFLARFGEWLNLPTLLIIMVAILVLFTVGILLWLKKRVEKTQTQTRLQTKIRVGKKQNLSSRDQKKSSSTKSSKRKKSSSHSESNTDI